MSLSQQLTDDLKQAMRAKDAVRLRTIRSLRAALLEADKRDATDLTEADALAVVQKQAKQRRDAIEQFEQAGRDDLAQKERDELALIETYLPKQLSDAEIRSAVQAIIDALGATSMQQMGPVMGRAMGQLRGKADGKRVQQVVRSLLSGG